MARTKMIINLHKGGPSSLERKRYGPTGAEHPQKPVYTKAANGLTAKKAIPAYTAAQGNVPDKSSTDTAVQQEVIDLTVGEE